MPGRNAALDRTRTALTVLVVIHHAIIPYTYYGHEDSKTWLGFDGVILATDSFFMALFFFLSGLFAWPSLKRKSVAHFLDERLLRLALPFAVAILFLMPLAYYAIELRTSDMSFHAFWIKTITVGPWPSGPVWFIWVLLTFDLVSVLLYKFAPDCLASLNRLSLKAFERPALFFAVFFAITAAAYVPMRLFFGVNHWFEFGPFSVQASRVLFYAAYFFIGAGVGLANVEEGLLGHKGELEHDWWKWMFAAVAAYSLIPTSCLIGGKSPTPLRFRCSARQSALRSWPGLYALTVPAGVFSTRCSPQLTVSS
jgi:fucose 4-O-acetylase-like acetyltransferase